MKSVPCPGCVGERTQIFQVEGLDCQNEAAVIESALRDVPGVCSVRVSPMLGQTTVVYTLSQEELEAAFARAGFRIHEVRRARKTITAIPAVASFALTGVGFLALLVSPRLAIAFFFPAIVVGGYPVARKGLLAIRQRALDMNSLMTVAVVGAACLGDWAEGATTVVLFSLAQMLESRSLQGARRAIGRLMALAPEDALVRRQGKEERIPAAMVNVGETMVVSPGERFALDGLVQAGASDVDQSPLTGESRLIPKGPGDEVFAGSVNGAGVLTVRVSRPAAETTLARIIQRVEDAQSSRAPSQTLVESFARVYTPLVVGFAALIAFLPPLLGMGSFAEWIHRALVLLVIACPCALVISTPVSVVSALTRASRRGVLIKGGAHLEAIGRVCGVVFDKTGTLTRGRPEVTDVIPADGHSARTVLSWAAAVEALSGHPLGEAVMARARAEGIAPDSAAAVTALAGRGVEGRIDGHRVLVGSHRLFNEARLCDHRLDAHLLRLEEEAKTALLVGRDGSEPEIVGVLGVTDAVRPEALSVVQALKRDGIRVAMLTGDNALTAATIARQLGVDQYRAELLPEDKVAHVSALTRKVGPVAMVGDGVNDAPALAAATVGIAMGGRGTDAALETADIVLMSDDLTRIPETIALGRATRRVVAQNVTVAILVKGAVLALALAGYATLWAAVAADMGASLLVIGNGLRLLRSA